MSLCVKIGAPELLDFDRLLSNTRELLTILPVIYSSTPGALAQLMTAIKQGFKAAQCGYTVTEEIIGLVSLSEHSSTRIQQDYLMGTIELAKKGHTEARRAYQTLTAAQKQMFRKSDRAMVAKFNSNTSNALMLLASEIFHLANWWGWIQIETYELQGIGKSSLSFDISSLNDEYTIEKWRHMRRQFLTYTSTMKELEDHYSVLFSMATDDEGDTHFGLEIPIRSDLKRAFDLVSFRNDPRRIPSHDALTLAVRIRGIPKTGHRIKSLLGIQRILKTLLCIGSYTNA